MSSSHLSAVYPSQSNMPPGSRASSSRSSINTAASSKPGQAGVSDSAASSSVSVIEADLPPPTDGREVSEEGKLKQLLGVLKKTIGVKDLGAVRLSLPATLLHPIPNLDYWCYLDRPDVFAAIGESDDQFERMLAVIRWTLTKDCKHVHGPICKPYNSVLGERFRCIYDVDPATASSGQLEVFETPAPESSATPALGTPSTNSSDENFHDAEASSPANPAIEAGVEKLAVSEAQNRPASLQTASTASTTDASASQSTGRTSNLSATGAAGSKKARVVFMNEQGDRKGKGKVIAFGVDQISAKFTGTSVKIFPGIFNKGIYVTLPDRGEEYEITHPTATVTGLIRANPYVVVCDNTYINCRGPKGKRYRALLNYVDESWLGKAKFALEGVIYSVEGDDSKEDEWTKLKHVPTDRIIAKLEGTWKGVIKVTRTSGDMTPFTLVDISKLMPLPKKVRDLSLQDEVESRRLWSDVTSAIQDKRYNEATKIKLDIEQKQRDIAAERKKKNEEFVPVLFAKGWEVDGRVTLTEEGKKTLEKELKAEGY